MATSSMSDILKKHKSTDGDKDKDDKSDKKKGNAMLSFIAKCKKSKD